MTLRQYVVAMLLATFGSWGGWLLVVTSLDPVTAGWLGFGLFYVTLFVACLGTFALVGVGVRLRLVRQEPALGQVTIAFRQAVSFSALVLAALFLQSKGLLTWWNMLLLVAALTLVEFAVLALSRREPPL
jgi:hypothetical protein